MNLTTAILLASALFNLGALVLLLVHLRRSARIEKTINEMKQVRDAEARAKSGTFEERLKKSYAARGVAYPVKPPEVKVGG